MEERRIKCVKWRLDSTSALLAWLNVTNVRLYSKVSRSWPDLLLHRPLIRRPSFPRPSQSETERTGFLLYTHKTRCVLFFAGNESLFHIVFLRCGMIYRIAEPIKSSWSIFKKKPWDSYFAMQFSKYSISSHSSSFGDLHDYGPAETEVMVS